MNRLQRAEKEAQLGGYNVHPNAGSVHPVIYAEGKVWNDGDLSLSTTV
jgi:hypothetical protein